MEVVRSGLVADGGLDKARLAKLSDGAHQFEAMMLTEMLKGVNFGAAPGDSGEDAGGAGSTMTGYGTEAMAKAISDGGGFGLAKQIVRQVAAEDALKGTGRTAGMGSKV